MTVEKMTETAGSTGSSQPSPTVDNIQNWLTAYLANLLEIDPSAIDVTTPFERYGLDSAAVVSLAGDLEEWLGTELDITLLYDHPTIAELSQHLAK